MPNYGPGSPGFVQSQTDVAEPDITGDITVYAGENNATLNNTSNVQSVVNAIVNSSNSPTNTFLAANASVLATGQSVIASASIAPGTWDLVGQVTASVGAASNQQEIALVPHGGAASVAYSSAVISPSLHAPEATGTVSANKVTVAALTQVDLVGYAGASSSWIALATTTGNSYANATGILASPAT